MRLLFVFCLGGLAWAAESTFLWRDPGAVQNLDLASGPGGQFNAPKAPFAFVKEETQGVTPKVVVVDARGIKWMVKFGDEAKAETFASRISWAAGYPVRASYYVKAGKIGGLSQSNRFSGFINGDGDFREARFQIFDHAGFRQIPGGELNLADRREDQRELNGLKLALLLVANWDVKTANSAMFETAGRRYSAISDWGASMGDPAAIEPTERKWNCQAFNRQTRRLMGGVEGGFVQFNYSHYASRHESALSNGIPVADLKWFMARMSRLTDAQIRAGLLASGATPEEARCFTGALRERLTLFAQTSDNTSNVSNPPVVTRTKTTTKTKISQ